MFYFSHETLLTGLILPTIINRDCYLTFVYGMALSHYQQKLSCIIITRMNESHPLVQIMCRSPVQLGHQIIQWASSLIEQKEPSLLTYTSFMHSSILYRHLLTTSMKALSSIRYEPVIVDDWSMEIPSNMCTCTHCTSFHPFIQSSTMKCTSLRRTIRFPHVEATFNEAFGKYNETKQRYETDRFNLDIIRTPGLRTATRLRITKTR
jgi:hypothetical protein